MLPAQAESRLFCVVATERVHERAAITRARLFAEKPMTKMTGMTIACAIAAITSVPAAAQQPTRAKVGMLTCRTSASVGLVIGSRQRLACRFRPDNGGPSEGYYGIIRRLGLDVGVTAGGVL